MEAAPTSPATPAAAPPSAAPEAALAEESDGGEDDDDHPGDAADRRVVDYSVPRNFELAEDRPLGLEALEFDSTATSGQIRVAEDSLVEARLRSLRANVPVVPSRVVVWMPRAGAKTFVVLGGQHTVKALLRLREELLDRGDVVPPAVSTVRAVVLAPETPLHVRQQYAGDHQQQQEAVTAIPLSRLVYFMYQHVVVDKMDRYQAMALAVQKTGRPRPETREALRRMYSHVLTLAESLGPKAEAAVRGLEARGPVVPGSFLCLRPLVHPVYRVRACAHLLDTKATLATFRNVCRLVLKDQWVDFAWRPGNPHIAEDKRMFLL